MVEQQNLDEVFSYITEFSARYKWIYYTDASEDLYTINYKEESLSEVK